MTHSRISSFISRALAISLLLVIGFTPSVAQKKKKGVAQEADTVALFRGVAVSADAVGLVQLAVSSYGQYEAALRVNLKDKYFPIVELGYGQADATDVTTSMSYKTKAPYARIGLDFNLLRNKHDIYRAYAGFRYGLTYYKFDVKGEGITDPVWGDEVPFSVTGVSANCHWMEGVFGVDAKIVGPLRLGWSVRYRFRIAHNDGTVGNTWYVPGYGKRGGTRLGGTFNIIFEI
jgi:hypothetical protein